MKKLELIQKKIRQQGDAKRALTSLRFFKTAPGQYGEGDTFLGLTVPQCRKVAKDFFGQLDLLEVVDLLRSPWHEERLTALFMLIMHFNKSEPREKQRIYRFYLKNTQYINNWDLVDCSAEHIVGSWLNDKERKKIYQLARSKNVWERRIAIIATFHFIKKGSAQDTLAVAKILLSDQHDLLHKATGWMLREVGKRVGQATEETFLKEHYQHMPRTMLRYAIERFPEKLRKKYLVKKQ